MIGQPAFEEIESGEWTAAAVAHNHTTVYADVIDLFLLIDPVSLLDDVFASTEPRAAAMAYEQLVEGGTSDWNGGE